MIEQGHGKSHFPEAMFAVPTYISLSQIPTPFVMPDLEPLVRHTIEHYGLPLTDVMHHTAYSFLCKLQPGHSDFLMLEPRDSRVHCSVVLQKCSLKLDALKKFSLVIGC